MNKHQMIGYQEALDLTLKTICPLEDGEIVAVGRSLKRVVSKNLYSRVDSPSIDASRKDGYAVLSHEIASATPLSPVQLKIVGTSAAGGSDPGVVTPGTAIRILTGAKIPEGATAVLSEEFTTRKKENLKVFNTARPGQNILNKGADVAMDQLIAQRGACLSPGLIGFLVSAGYGQLPVYRQPKIAILATGDELVIPGQPLSEGKLYASNLEMIKAWCQRFNLDVSFEIVKDSLDTITEKVAAAIATHDAVITSGGAWSGDRDFVGQTLENLGWEKRFHSIRIGPGKPVGFGLLNSKPVFLLPGGPPSNLTAFLQIALPGILRLGGHSNPLLPIIAVRLLENLSGRHIDWTEFIYGQIETHNGQTNFTPLKLTNRLASMASANSIISIPEGVKSLEAGTMVTAQLLS